MEDATLEFLCVRLKLVQEGHKSAPEISRLLDLALQGHEYEEYGTPPIGNPDVLERWMEPIRRVVVFTDDVLVTRGPAVIEIDPTTGWRDSNGRYEEYGRLYRRARPGWL